MPLYSWLKKQWVKSKEQGENIIKDLVKHMHKFIQQSSSDWMWKWFDY
jgi:hypothetical protein